MPKWSEVPWGTVITGVVAVYGAVLSTFTLVGQHRRDRLAEGEVQRQLRRDQSAREEAQRHQAEQVTAWLVPYDGTEKPGPGQMFAGLIVRNGSSEVVYQLIASVVSLQGTYRETRVGSPDIRFRSFIGQVPPGETKTAIDYGGSGMYRSFGVELAFQDAAGRYWLRQGNGLLQEVDQNPVDLYGIDRPVPWGPF
jgi:hypothetical protein